MEIEGEVKIDNLGLPYIQTNNKRVYLHTMLDRFVANYNGKKVKVVIMVNECD